MKKIFTRLPILIFALFFFGLFGGLPVDAQLKEKCTLVDDVDARITVSGQPYDIRALKKGSVVSSNIELDEITGVKISIGGVGPTEFLAGSELSSKAGGVKAIKAGVSAVEKKWALICLVNTANNITNWIFIALLIVAVAFIAIAGFMWMTAGGDAERQKKAGTMILAAVIGIIIAILARVIPGIVTGIIL